MSASWRLPADPEKIDEGKAAIEAAIDRPMILSDWRQRNRTLFGVLQVERNVMFLILTLIVIVADA
jgi:lipoprotein-releasing system permease protein